MAEKRTKRTLDTGRIDWKPAFLKALANSGIVLVACKTAGIGRSIAYQTRRKNAKFAEQWDDAIEDSLDILEAEARTRATKGTARPVFYQGSKCGEIQEYSDALIMFLLKGGRPEKYRENYDAAKIARELIAQLAGSAELAGGIAKGSDNSGKAKG